MNESAVSCDVLVVGGGPGGSTCARDLVRAGLDVVVIDKARFPRDKVCAGWITPGVVDALGLDLADYAAGRTLQPFHGFRTSALGHAEICNSYGAPISHGIRRCEFDHYLLERCGARLLPGETVRRIERSAGQWIINNRIRARWLIGAGGHFCPVARWLNPERDEGPLVTAQEIEFPLTSGQQSRCGIEATMPALYFCPDRKGYGWAVRKGDYLNIGFGRLHPSAPPFPELLWSFQEFLRVHPLLPPDLPANWKGHAYRIHALPQRRCVGDSVLLVGDSAGLANPISGEGILTAIESGRLAARAVSRAAREGSEAPMLSYPAALEARYGRAVPSDTDPRFLSTHWVSWVGVQLLRSRWFSRHILLDRWFLHRHRRPLPEDVVGELPVKLGTEVDRPRTTG